MITLNSNLILLILNQREKELDKREAFKFQSDSINTELTKREHDILYDL